jgi:hypothetical protein
MSWSDRKVSRMAVAGLVVALNGGYASVGGAQPGVPPAELRQRAIAALRGAMKEGKRFEKVHAAEALLWSGQPEGVREYFLEQDRLAASDPMYWIGVQRVLNRTSAGDPAAQAKSLDAILAVFSDDKAKARGTAAETLAKLRYAERTPTVLDLAENGKADIRVSARWILASSGRAEDEAYLAEMLGSQSPPDRFYAAYAFRHFRSIRPTTLKALRDLAAKEPSDGEVRCYVSGTLYTHLPAAERESAKKDLLSYATSGNTDQRYQGCMALANWPSEDMIAVAEKLLDNGPVDERVGGAYLLLKIGHPRDDADPNH